MVTLLEWGQVDSKVKQFSEMNGIKSYSDAFSLFWLTELLDIDIEDAKSSYTDGPNDRGVDAVHIDERYGRNVVSLFQFKTVSKYEKCSNNFPSGEIDKIVSFIDDFLNKKMDMENSCNPLLWIKVNEIWGALERGNVDFRVVFCSNCEPLVPTQLSRVSSSLDKYNTFDVAEYHLRYLSDLLLKKRRSLSKRKIQLIEDQNYARTDGGLRGLIGGVKAKSLVRFLALENDSGSLDKNLFEENVRVYLGEKNSVNKKIFDSATSRESHKFWYLNNGITIVCDAYDYQPGESSPIVTITNPQIVNGGQTSNSLFEAYNSNPDLVGNTSVLVKVIETKDVDFTNKIAEATNSQTPIRSRDLRANDDMQVKIENTLVGYGYHYERKKNQHDSVPSHEKIDALKLGQLILSYYIGEPHLAKTSSDKIFGEMYEFIFNEASLNVDKIITVIKLYKLVEEKKALAIKNLKSGISPSYREAWLVEGSYHAMFMVRRLCERDGVALEDFEEASKFLPDALDHISKFMKNKKGLAAYRVFRSSATKVSLSKMHVPEQMSLLDRI